jgi:hypothetical protein
VITNALPEQALQELLELTGATRIEEHPGSGFASPRSFDEEEDDAEEDEKDDDEDELDDEEEDDLD